MVVVDGQAIPIGADLDSASASEIKRQQPTIEKIAMPRKGAGRSRQNPVRIIADKGYDSDPLGQRRLKGDIELICRREIQIDQAFFHLAYILITLRPF